MDEFERECRGCFDVFPIGNLTPQGYCTECEIERQRTEITELIQPAINEAMKPAADVEALVSQIAAYDGDSDWLDNAVLLIQSFLTAQLATKDTEIERLNKLLYSLRFVVLYCSECNRPFANADINYSLICENYVCQTCKATLQSAKGGSDGRTD